MSMKYINVSPAKFSQRVKKVKPVVANYKQLLKLDKPRIILEDPDSDEDDENQRKKLNQKKDVVKKKIDDNKRAKTPKKSVFEEQFSQSNVFKIRERPKTMSMGRLSLDLNRCHRTSHTKQRSRLKISQPAVPVLVNNALRESNIKKQPKQIKTFLSNLRFSSMELKPSSGLELISVDSHISERPRTSLMSIGSREILAESAQIKAILSFEELKGLVSQKLAINYKK